MANNLTWKVSLIVSILLYLTAVIFQDVTSVVINMSLVGGALVAFVYAIKDGTQSKKRNKKTTAT